MKRLSLSLIGLLLWTAASSAYADEKGIDLQKSKPSTSDDSEKSKPTLSEARRQAEVLQTTVDSVLRLVHDRYYREDEGLPLPAATLKDVFKDLEKRNNVKLRWLAVEGQAMNTDHKARTDFEHKAVAVLKADHPFHEETSDRMFRRAVPITLSNHCLKCHVPDRRSLEDRTAGLIIEIAIAAP